MKVGILTFPHAPSLGAMLQMGALYHAIEQEGHTPEVVNYMSDNVIHCRPKKKTLKGRVISLFTKMLVKSSAPSFADFEEKLNMFPEKASFFEEALRKIEQHFDRIIVGSDQVWNPIVTGNDMNF